MSFVSSGGASKISQVMIDSDKNWGGFEITNVKEVVAGMAVGDLLYFDGTTIQKTSPGVIGTELITRGTGHAPFWGYVA